MVEVSLKKEKYSSTYLSQLKQLAGSFFEDPPTSSPPNPESIEGYLLASPRLCHRMVSGEFDHLTWNFPTDRRNEWYIPRPRSKTRRSSLQKLLMKEFGLDLLKRKSIVNLVNRIEDNLGLVSGYHRLPKLIWLLKVIFELRKDPERAALCDISNIRPTTLRKYEDLWAKLKSSFNVEITTST